MSHRLLSLSAIVFAATGVVAASQAGAPGSTPTPTAASAATAATERALVDRYCVSCHSAKLKTAGLVLESLDLTRPQDHAAVWEKVIGKLRSGAMPPQGQPRPDKATLDNLFKGLEVSLDRAAAARPNPGRRPALHRLNRGEYGNAIRDLLALDIDVESLLPPDDSGYGFDNIADVLTVSPLLTERYLSVARKISRLAVGDPTLRPVTDSFSVNKYLLQDDRASEDLPFGSRGGLAVRYYFPVDGDYFVKIYHLRTYDGRIRGLVEPHQLEVRLNGAKIKQFTVGGAGVGEPDPRDDPQSTRTRATRAQVVDGIVDGLEVKFTAKAGPGVLAVSYVKESARPEGMRRPKYSVTTYEYAGDSAVLPGVGSVEIRGPYGVTGPGESPSRARVFVCRPSAGASTAEEDRCARQIVSTIARRAYRRPVTDQDIQPLLAFYKEGRTSGTFDAGIEMALRRILVSPDFIFRMERAPATIRAGAAYRISDLELASRLSFFLWSTIPDDELLDLAARGQLQQPAVLEQQVRRMLADTRARELVSNFTGQWLYLRNIRLVTPDPLVFPDFDENLRLAFEREASLFLESQVRDDRPVADLLTADYTFVNERLARHYGMPNVYGSHFRRVALTEDARRGLLGKGGILTLTSYAHRTSPVLRGKWLLENILGAPPPPPPPNVPALKENSESVEKLSVRDRMERHRANPVCASCHKVMDPLGFALENFDAIGRWRTTNEAGAPVEASTVLADGTAVDSPTTLRRALLEHRDDFALTVTSKLMTYALGRGVEYYDMPAVRQVLRDAAPGGYTWSSIVVGIVKSQPFQMRLADEQKTVALMGAQPRARLGDPAMPQALQQADTARTARAESVR